MPASLSPTSPAILAPGATLGILGGGQLGRMTALAAARLGYRTHIFCPENDGPGSQVSTATTRAAFEDQEALARFADAVDVVTLEWENVPADSVSFLARRVPVRPGANVLAVTQDRVAEKAFANRLGLPTAPWRTVGSLPALVEAVAALGRPAVLKTARMGYDGKGQVLIGPDADLAAAWAVIGSGRAESPAILEGFVSFRCEVSVIVARREDGAMASFPVVENEHRHHILWRTLAPARIPAATAAAAEDAARRLAQALGVVGLLAVEMFIAADGTPLVNELAPRPHNSGHWTQDACATSQFEQLVRAVCGLPLGDTTQLFPAEMTNLLGDEADSWATHLADPACRLHLYGKTEARPGRKMGHVNRLFVGNGLGSGLEGGLRPEATVSRKA